MNIDRKKLNNQKEKIKIKKKIEKNFIVRRNTYDNKKPKI